MDNDQQQPVAIGRVISQLRREAGLTQANVAESLRYSAAKVSRIETGEVAVAADELSQLLSAIDTPTAREFGDYIAHLWTERYNPKLWIVTG